jgi:hypothetical protein
MQAGNRVVNWPLDTEVACTYHGPLRKCQVQEIWTGGGILVPHTVSVPSIG